MCIYITITSCRFWQSHPPTWNSSARLFFCMVVDAATAACFFDFAASLYWLPNVSFATLFAGCIIFQRHQLCQANTSSDFVARLVSCLTLFASVCSWQIFGRDHDFHVSLGKMPTTPSVPSCQADVPGRLADAVRHPSVPAT